MVQTIIGFSRSQVQAEIGAAADQLDFVETFQNPLSAAAIAANEANFVRVRLSRAITVTTMSYVVGTASGNVDLGIYDSADGGATLTRLASTGSTVASGATALQAIALTAGITLVTGKDYWFAFAADNAVITAFRVSAPITYLSRKQRTFSKATSFPLPASVASPTAGGKMFWLEAS